MGGVGPETLGRNAQLSVSLSLSMSETLSMSLSLLCVSHGSDSWSIVFELYNHICSYNPENFERFCAKPMCYKI